MRTSYFSFGQIHAYSFNGHTLDKDVLVKITAENPREVMMKFFGTHWGFEYGEEILEDLEYFPRGIYDLTNNKWI